MENGKSGRGGLLRYNSIAILSIGDQNYDGI